MWAQIMATPRQELQEPSLLSPQEQQWLRLTPYQQDLEWVLAGWQEGEKRLMGL